MASLQTFLRYAERAAPRKGARTCRQPYSSKLSAICRRTGAAAQDERLVGTGYVAHQCTHMHRRSRSQRIEAITAFEDGNNAPFARGIGNTHQLLGDPLEIAVF